MPRRRFLRVGLLTTAACALANAPLAKPWLTMAQAATPDAIHETLHGLLAFIVLGPDAYSHAQGVTTSDPGGVDAHVAEVLIATLDLSAPFLPSFSGVVAAILNDLAQQVHPAPAGPFQSPFANLTYPEKVAVLQLMDATETLQALGGILPAFVAYLCYSDAGTFDPATISTPVPCTIASVQFPIASCGPLDL